ncbi:atrophin-1-like [Peromyscus eremicus]|uniref:atrophin-1-like n=1 Tax=Peromyscus eremicus TaxID=42410 RepID=UPI0027DCE50F|nr:atrophin-1-like [Peromyscus eremicus]
MEARDVEGEASLGSLSVKTCLSHPILSFFFGGPGIPTRVFLPWWVGSAPEGCERQPSRREGGHRGEARLGWAGPCGPVGARGRKGPFQGQKVAKAKSLQHPTTAPVAGSLKSLAAALSSSVRRPPSEPSSPTHPPPLSPARAPALGSSPPARPSSARCPRPRPLAPGPRPAAGAQGRQWPAFPQDLLLSRSSRAGRTHRAHPGLCSVDGGGRGRSRGQNSLSATRPPGHPATHPPNAASIKEEPRVFSRLDRTRLRFQVGPILDLGALLGHHPTDSYWPAPRPWPLGRAPEATNCGSLASHPTGDTRSHTHEHFPPPESPPRPPPVEPGRQPGAMEARDVEGEASLGSLSVKTCLSHPILSFFFGGPGIPTRVFLPWWVGSAPEGCERQPSRREGGHRGEARLGWAGPCGPVGARGRKGPFQGQKVAKAKSLQHPTTAPVAGSLKSLAAALSSSVRRPPSEPSSPTHPPPLSPARAPALGSSPPARPSSARCPRPRPLAPGPRPAAGAQGRQWPAFPQDLLLSRSSRAGRTHRAHPGLCSVDGGGRGRSRGQNSLSATRPPGHPATHPPNAASIKEEPRVFSRLDRTRLRFQVGPILDLGALLGHHPTDSYWPAPRPWPLGRAPEATNCGSLASHPTGDTRSHTHEHFPPPESPPRPPPVEPGRQPGAMEARDVEGEASLGSLSTTAPVAGSLKSLAAALSSSVRRPPSEPSSPTHPPSAPEPGSSPTPPSAPARQLGPPQPAARVRGPWPLARGPQQGPRAGSGPPFPRTFSSPVPHGPAALTGPTRAPGRAGSALGPRVAPPRGLLPGSQPLAFGAG